MYKIRGDIILSMMLQSRTWSKSWFFIFTIVSLEMFARTEFSQIFLSLLPRKFSVLANKKSL